jgi:EmrB/QacA subfamily drug resistance transporter
VTATVALAVVAVFVAYLPISSVSVSLSTISAATHATSSDLQWVSDAYVLPMAAAILSAGTFGDIYGRRRIYLIGMGLVGLGALIAGFAVVANNDASLDILWGGQAVMGVGAGMLLPTTLALIAHAVPDHKERTRHVALWASGLVGGLALGPVISGVLLEHYSWGWIFAPTGVLAVLTLLLAPRWLPESRSPEARRLDWAGQGLGTATIVCSIFGVIEAGDRGWRSTLAVSSLAIAAASLVCFVFAELRSDSPILDPRLFGRRPFAVAGIAAWVMMAVISGALFLLGVYLGVGEHLPPLQIGERLFVFMAVTVLLNPIAGAAMRRWHPVLVLGSGLAIGSIGCWSLTHLGAHAGFLSVTWRLAILGVGDAFALGAVSVAAIGAVPHQLAGVAATGNTALRQLGAALGPAIFGVIYQSKLTGGDSSTAGLHFAFAISAIAFGTVAIGCLIVGVNRSGSEAT